MRSADAARAAAERGLARAREQRGIREALATRRWEQRTGAALLSGGLAYRLFLWLVPFGLVVAALLSFWVRVDANGLERTARSFGLTGVAAHSATSAVHDGSRARWYLLIAGVGLMLWAGAGAVRALRVVSRLAWGIDVARLRRPLRSSAVFTVVCVLGLAASVAASWTRHHTATVGLLVTLANVFVDVAIALFALSHLPRPEGMSWRELWPGALLIAIGITAVHVFLAYFLASRLESSPDLYGTLGAATTVLLVLFLIARLIVAGMFLNATLRRGRLSEQG
jgi:uncharacterized BrkB/YihY/UPF0761 family membrane protein